MSKKRPARSRRSKSDADIRVIKRQRHHASINLEFALNRPSPVQITLPLSGTSKMPTLSEYLEGSAHPANHDTIRGHVVDFGSAQHKTLGRLSNLTAGKMIFLRPASSGYPTSEVHFVIVEHFYQSERFRLASMDDELSDDQRVALMEIAKSVRTTRGPLKAKQLAKENDQLINPAFQALWDSKLKVGVMRYILSKKFGDSACFWRTEVGERMKQTLRETRHAYLREVCKAHVDRFWAVSLRTGEGHNMLGRLLMEMRDQI